MPRTVDITVPPEETEHLLQRASGLEGIIGIRVQPGAGRQPQGDVISLDVTTRTLPSLTRLLAELGTGKGSGSSFSTTEPLSIVSSPSAGQIANDRGDATWEEMEMVIAKNSNMTSNGLLAMAIAGVLATVGIATNSLHVVIGAMLIAPGFQPIIRISLGIVGQSATWRLGMGHTLKGYLALFAGAVITAWILQLSGRSPLGVEPSYLPSGVLISYWTTINFPTVLVTSVSGAAGAILVASNRAVLTAGVMVALALVPGAAIAGLAVAAGDLSLAATGVVRWLMEAALVLVTSIVVLGWKRVRLHRRPMLE